MLVDGDRIAWVGREADLSPDRYPADTPVRALGPVTVLPGLIDCHVHLAFDGGPAPVTRMRAEDDARQVALMTRNARRLLSVGVTTARDLGCRGYLGVSVRDAIADGTLRGPRLLTAGPPLTVTGGHCWFMGAEVDTEQDVRRMVRRHHKHGVDLVKLMSTGGFMTEGSAPWFAQFEPAEVRAAVEEAHRVGKRVAAHVHGVVGIERALDAGVDTLEHCTFVHADGGPAWCPSSPTGSPPRPRTCRRPGTCCCRCSRNGCPSGSTCWSRSTGAAPGSSPAPTPASTTCRTTASSRLAAGDGVRRAAERRGAHRGHHPGAEALGLATVTGALSAACPPT